MKKALYILMAVVLVGVVVSAHADSGDALLTLRQKLASQFALTKTTAAQDDIVTAGSVLVLHKDGLLMNSIASGPASNTYKEGKLSHGIKIPKCPSWSPYCPPLPPAAVDRTFVAGEKFWVTDIDVELDCVTFSFFTDQIDDTRYHGKLKFPFPKGQTPSVDGELSAIAQVITSEREVASPEPPQPPAPQPTPGPKKPDPLPPPPAPSDAAAAPTKTISAGESKAEVFATFGVPERVIKLPNKEIDYYPDMKVTYVNDKVMAIDEVPSQSAFRKVSQ
jgi:hypothetical protein